MRSLSHYLRHIQIDLFPALEEILGRLSPGGKRLVEILEVVQIERLVNTSNFGLIGRPLKERRPIARAFVAKSVLGLTTTRSLLHALAGSPKLSASTAFRRWRRSSLLVSPYQVEANKENVNIAFALRDVTKTTASVGVVWAGSIPF